MCLLLSGCGRETDDNSKDNIVINNELENASGGEGSSSCDSQRVPEKRKVDFWDDNFGYQITGESEVYIADVQDGQDGATQQQGVDYYNGFGEKNIVEVNIPENVIHDNITYEVVGIGFNSFTGCDYVKSILMPNTIRDVEYNAFYSCSKVENIVWSAGLEYIGGNAFSICYINDIHLPNSLRIIGDGIFMFNDYIKEIVIPANVELLGNEVFYDCANLEKVTILATKIEVGAEAFALCDSLKEVYVPEESLQYYEKSFDEYDFEVLSIEALTNIDTLRAVPTKREVDFWNGQFGYQITGDSEVYIADVQDGQDGSSQQPGMMYNYDNEILKDLVEVNITDEVIYNNITYRIVGVGHYSFTGCFNVKSIRMPDTLRIIESDAFHDCSQVEYIIWSTKLESIGNYSFSLGKMNEVKLPESLIKIGDGSLWLNDNIKEIVIPAKIEMMGNLVFLGCANLEKVTLLAANIEIGEDIFDSCRSLKEVYVPKKSLNYYNNYFAGWSFDVVAIESYKNPVIKALGMKWESVKEYFVHVIDWKRYFFRNRVRSIIRNVLRYIILG
jgi:hypothetical protein